MKIIFMGTPNFAIPILEKICSKHEVVLVVTQPDQYNYKKKTIKFSPVKEWAISKGLEVFQPEKIKLDKDVILNKECDLIITSAYGQIVPEDILNHPKYKCINVHGSLLPKYRGGAPIQRSIINGDKETGITIMYMAKKMDAGDMLYVKKIDIEDTDTQDSLFEKLSYLASDIILDVIDDIEKGNINPVPQNEDDVTYAPNLTKDDEKIDFNKTARNVFNQIRGLNSNPGAFFTLDNINIKVYNSKVVEKIVDKKPGTIVSINKDNFEVSCGLGTVIAITELQIPGKNKMAARDFINGQGRKILSVDKEI